MLVLHKWSDGFIEFKHEFFSYLIKAISTNRNAYLLINVLITLKFLSLYMATAYICKGIPEKYLKSIT